MVYFINIINTQVLHETNICLINKAIENSIHIKYKMVIIPELQIRNRLNSYFLLLQIKNFVHIQTSDYLNAIIYV